MKAAKLILLGIAGGPTAAATPMMQRPGSVWGQVPVEPEGLAFGGPEISATLLIGLLVVLLLLGTTLWQARGLLRRASGAEGYEVEFLFMGAEKIYRRAIWVVYGLLPILAVLTLVLGSPGSIFGIGVHELGLALFLVGCLFGCGTFLVLEAVRRGLGSERV